MSATTKDTLLGRIDRLTGELKLSVTRSGDDTLDMRFAVRPPKSGTAKRWLVFMNGRTEWAEKYSYVAEDLDLGADTGFLTWDHRGQGASGGARSYVDDYASYALDSQRLVREVVGDKPYAVVAHSMGGLIALSSTLTGRLAPDALVLCSPLLGLPNNPVPRPVARPVATLLTLARLGALSSGAGTFTNIPFEGNNLTHHAELYRRLQNTPYQIPGATFGWVAATFRALDLCFDPKRLAELKAPTLVLGGTAERVVDADAFKAWVQAASQAAKAEIELRLFPGARHELLSEIPEYYEPAVEAIKGWLRKVWKA